MAKNSSPSKAPKNGAQLRENPEEREKRPKRPRNPVKPPGRHKHRHTARRNNVQISSANRAWTSEAPSRRKHEILPKARGLTHERSTTAHRNNVQIFKCELGLKIGVHIHVENVEIQLKASTCRCTHTGMSTTAQNTKNCTCRRNNGQISTLSKNCTCGIRRNLLHNRNVHHSEDELNLGQDSNLWTAGTVAADHRDIDAKNSLLHSLH